MRVGKVSSVFGGVGHVTPILRMNLIKSLNFLSMRDRVELIVNINLNFLKKICFKNSYLGFWSRNYTEGILPGLHYAASKRLSERTESADFYLWANQFRKNIYISR